MFEIFWTICMFLFLPQLPLHTVLDQSVFNRSHNKECCWHSAGHAMRLLLFYFDLSWHSNGRRWWWKGQHGHNLVDSVLVCCNSPSVGSLGIQIQSIEIPSVAHASVIPHRWVNGFKDATTTGTSCKPICVQSGVLAMQWTTSVCTIVSSCCMTLWVLGHFGDWDLLAVLARSVVLFWVWWETQSTRYHQQFGLSDQDSGPVCSAAYQAIVDIVANSVDKSHKLSSKSCWQRSHKSRQKPVKPGIPSLYFFGDSDTLGSLPSELRTQAVGH